MRKVYMQIFSVSLYLVWPVSDLRPMARVASATGVAHVVAGMQASLLALPPPGRCYSNTALCGNLLYSFASQLVSRNCPLYTCLLMC